MVGCCYAVSFMLTVVYAKCHKVALYAESHFSAIMLTVVMLSVVVPFKIGSNLNGVLRPHAFAKELIHDKLGCFSLSVIYT
jgi:hypothetical protein